MSNKQTVFETEWFSVERETFDREQSLNGKPYYRINSHDGIIILATTTGGEIILVNQFRPALNQHTLEFPSGAIDPGESAEKSAARELREETGYVCSELRLLAEGRILPSRLNSREFVFYGIGAVKAPDIKVEESVKVVLATPAQLKSLVLAGKFDQLVALSLLTLADWKFSCRFVEQS